MTETTKRKIVTANDLLEGDVIFLNRAGGWTRNIALAAIAEDDAKASELLAQAQQPLTVVGPYLVDVELDTDGRPAPLQFREVVRGAGPTNRPDLRRASMGL